MNQIRYWYSGGKAVRFTFFDQKCPLWVTKVNVKFMVRIYVIVIVVATVNTKVSFWKELAIVTQLQHTIVRFIQTRLFSHFIFQGQNPLLLFLCQFLCIMQIFLPDTTIMSNGNQDYNGVYNRWKTILLLDSLMRTLISHAVV